MPHILRRHRKTVTTETWTIVWSKEGLSASGEMPAELPPADQTLGSIRAAGPAGTIRQQRR